MIIKMKEMTKMEKVGEGEQGIVYKAEWRGITVLYKQMKLMNTYDKKVFMRVQYLAVVQINNNK